MSWSCKKCTFLNPLSQKPTCQICLSQSSPPPSAPSSSANANCEICDTRASLSTMSSFEDLRDTSDGDRSGLDSSGGTVFFPLQCCKRKRGDQVGGGGGYRVEGGKSCPASNSWKIVSYNAWFREDLEMHKRTKAISELIQMHSPHFICFQDVTPNIYDIFWLSIWWKLYHCSVSGDAASLTLLLHAELCIVKVEVERKKPLTIAVSHLKSPCSAPPKWDQMRSKERLDQAKEAMDHLGKHPNVILRGDMNRDNKSDGRFPLCDEWGWTYDTKSNSALSANCTLQKRLDWFLCNLHNFKITSIDMIGREAIASLTYCKEKKVRKELTNLVLLVLPSDHFSLLLTIGSK
ncbi:hypothetical protein BT93_H3173 [Corymbia citriodora subsp. variegata]|nr:hypothetical protein BT93_H3173 [Corymbia citriodora subsp. variegata]